MSKDSLNTYKVSIDAGPSGVIDQGLYVTNNVEEAIREMLNELMCGWDVDPDLVQIKFVDWFPGPNDTLIDTYSIYIVETDKNSPLPSLHYPETCYVELFGAEPVRPSAQKTEPQSGDLYSKPHRFYSMPYRIEPLVESPAKEVEPQSSDFKWKINWLHIVEGQSGFSYKSLFLPYLRDSLNIKIQEPHLTNNYQKHNFNRFCEILYPTNAPLTQLKLITSYGYYTQIAETRKYLEVLTKKLTENRIEFEYEIRKDIHERRIETDTGWIITLTRGLDIFHKSRTEPEPTDQTKRKCKETSIFYCKKKERIGYYSNLMYP